MARDLYARRNNAVRRASALDTEAQRHIRNAAKARIREAQARLDAALVCVAKDSYMKPDRHFEDAHTCIGQAEELTAL